MLCTKCWAELNLIYVTILVLKEIRSQADKCNIYKDIQFLVCGLCKIISMSEVDQKCKQGRRNLCRDVH